MRKLPSEETMLKVIEIDDLRKADMTFEKISKKLGYKGSHPSPVCNLYFRNKQFIYYFKQKYLRE